MTGFWKRTISIGMARAFMGVIIILAGFILALWIPVRDMQTSSVAFTVYLSFSIGFITSGMILIVEGGLDHLTHHSSD